MTKGNTGPTDGEGMFVKSSSIRTTASLMGIFLTIAAMVGAWSVLGYRLEQAEKSIEGNRAAMKDLAVKRDADREILIRIDERLKRVEEQVTRLSKIGAVSPMPNLSKNP